MNETTVEFYSDNINGRVRSLLEFNCVDMQDIENALKSIKSNAIGADKINLKMLKLVFPFCKEALKHIINYSLINGVVPKSWKISIVKPLPKIPVANDFSQLRPINILPTMSKLIEKIVSTKLSKHLKDNCLLPATQCG